MAGFFAQAGKRSDGEFIEDRDIFAAVDLHRCKDALLAIIICPIELSGVHRRARSLEHAEHADDVALLQPRIGWDICTSTCPLQSIQPLHVFIFKTDAVTTCLGGIARYSSNEDVSMRGG